MDKNLVERVRELARVLQIDLGILCHQAGDPQPKLAAARLMAPVRDYVAGCQDELTVNSVVGIKL